MSVYVIAQITIHDRPRYERYVARFMEVLRPYGGRLLAAATRRKCSRGPGIDRSSS